MRRWERQQSNEFPFSFVILFFGLLFCGGLTKKHTTTTYISSSHHVGWGFKFFRHDTKPTTQTWFRNKIRGVEVGWWGDLHTHTHTHIQKGDTHILLVMVLFNSFFAQGTQTGTPWVDWDTFSESCPRESHSFPFTGPPSTHPPSFLILEREP